MDDLQAGIQGCCTISVASEPKKIDTELSILESSPKKKALVLNPKTGILTSRSRSQCRS